MIGYLVIAHIVICALVYQLMRLGYVKAGKSILPVAAFVPIFGFAVVILEELVARGKQLGSQKIDLQELKIRDVKYRRIQIGQDANQNITVPLEEAILINEEEVRRKLMLEILHKNPEDYINLLQRTKLSDDVELTHYATTSIMEIQSKYEFAIQRMSERCRKNPKDIACLEEYKNELKRYIESELISGNILIIYRQQLEAVLQQLVTLDEENKEYRYELIDNQIECKHYEGIEDHLALLKERWKKDVELYKLYIRYYFCTQQGERIAEVLNEMKQESMYLTHQQKEWFQFWSQEEV